jgi:hypothetical protein
MNRFLVLFLFLLFNSTGFSQTPYNGVYTIGGSNPDFATIKDAIDSLDYHGVNDTVVLNIRSGNYTSYTWFVTKFGFNYPVIFQSEA